MPLDTDIDGTLGNDTPAADHSDTAQAMDADTVQAADASASTSQEESFVDPATLPPELKAHWKRMHGAYTKSREELKTGREATAQVKRFYSDPDFALQTIRQVASQLGYQLQKPGQETAQASKTGSGAPAELVDKIKAQLAPELQWMAPSLAASQWETIQTALAPIQQRQEQDSKQRREELLNEAEAEMDEKYPGWDEHKDELTGIVSWIQDGPVQHPKYGNKYEAAYKFWQLMTGQDGAFVAQAARKMGDAARSRTTGGTTSRQAVPNHEERIRKAKTREEAWAIAEEVGKAEARRLGATVD